MGSSGVSEGAGLCPPRDRGEDHHAGAPRLAGLAPGSPGSGHGCPTTEATGNDSAWVEVGSADQPQPKIIRDNLDDK